ncbi:hypothetical protein CAter10_1689 [Collimonas arenae]|nr:hypothetical protein CAter10_1689 [Collimonas arenae]
MAAGTVLLLMPRYEVHSAPGDIQLASASPGIPDVGFQLRFAPSRIDFIDFSGLSGGFAEVYFGEHRVWYEGKELQKVRDFRLLPAPWGVRLLFNRPINTDQLVFAPGAGVAEGAGGVSIKISSYAFHLGRPRLFHD